MLILNLQRMSTEDGPGIRTTLFVKGCPLKCKWCHNPESISYEKQIEWFITSCIGCDICIENCHEKALSRQKDGIEVDRAKCRLCLKCVDNCPAVAWEVKGIKMNVEELFDELVKDRAYFGIDGGVTLSGGEIMSQSEEGAELLKRLRESGINTAIDTSGLCKKDDIDRVLPYTDLILYDIKLIDKDQHKKYTGCSNEIILDNFNYITDKIKGTDKKVWIRTPIIPDATDNEENIRGIARFIKGRADRWELTAFNNLCRDKYLRLGLDWDYMDAKLIDREKMDLLVKRAKEEGFENVIWTGAVRLKEGEGI